MWEKTALLRGVICPLQRASLARFRLNLYFEGMKKKGKEEDWQKANGSRGVRIRERIWEKVKKGE